MKCLLDLSALLAFGIIEHEIHERVAGSVHTSTPRGVRELATCSNIELSW